MNETLDPKTIGELTTEIVSAYVAHHTVAVADVPVLIGAVAKRLHALAAEKEEAEPARPEPAVFVRRSVSPEHLTCLVCGQKVSTLKRHLRAAHGLTPEAYRELFGLGRDYPMIAAAYAERRAEIARRIGLGGARPAPQPEPAHRPTPSRRRRGAKGRRRETEPALA